MTRFAFLLLLCLLSGSSFAQAPCTGFHHDSLSLDRAGFATENLELMDVTIRNNYVLQFIRKEKALFLRIVVRDNLGYGQSGELLLICGKKQIYDRDVKLVSPDGQSGYAVLELNPNYIQTISQLGLSSIIFRNKVEFTVPKSDSEKIKQTAACFFDAVIGKR